MRILKSNTIALQWIVTIPPAARSERGEGKEENNKKVRVKYAGNTVNWFQIPSARLQLCPTHITNIFPFPKAGNLKVRLRW